MEDTEIVYRYSVAAFDNPMQAEDWLNEQAEEGYRMEKILVNKEGETTKNFWFVMERADEVDVDDFETD